MFSKIHFSFLVLLFIALASSLQPQLLLDIGSLMIQLFKCVDKVEYLSKKKGFLAKCQLQQGFHGQHLSFLSGVPVYSK